MLTKEVLRSYLLDMPSGHIFDLTYRLFADVFPPGEPDEGARAALRQFAQECGCDVRNDVSEDRYELIRR
jgi:hypothetical protein